MYVMRVKDVYIDIFDVTVINILLSFLQEHSKIRLRQDKEKLKVGIQKGKQHEAITKTSHRNPGI